MRKAYNRMGVEIGLFNGTFVIDGDGEKFYWIDGKDVFSICRNDNRSRLCGPPIVRVGEFIGEVAVDESGKVIFTTNLERVNPVRQSEIR